MKNLKKWITSPSATIALFVLAAGLLLFSTIGSAWAALKYFSQIYKGHVEMYDIGVELLEKSSPDGDAEKVAWRTYKKNSQDEWDETPGDEHIGVLLANMLPAGEDGKTEELVPGKKYFEEISCRNSGTIDQYVRITLYKYWVNADGEKVFTGSDNDPVTTQGLSPDLIKFTFPYLGSDWIKDEKNSAKTEEREIYYYNKLLKAGEDTSATPLTGTLTIDQLVGLKVNKDIIEGEDGKKTIIVSYKYDGWKFCVEADVDAVQDHNAEDAIRSAWGRDVTISNGTLSLN